jgi:hypothetical protein
MNTAAKIRRIESTFSAKVLRSDASIPHPELPAAIGDETHGHRLVYVRENARGEELDRALGFALRRLLELHDMRWVSLGAGQAQVMRLPRSLFSRKTKVRA